MSEYISDLREYYFSGFGEECISDFREYNFSLLREEYFSDLSKAQCSFIGCNTRIALRELSQLYTLV